MTSLTTLALTLLFFSILFLISFIQLKNHVKKEYTTNDENPSVAFDRSENERQSNMSELSYTDGKLEYQDYQYEGWK